MRALMWLLLVALLVGTLVGARLVYENNHPADADNAAAGPAANPDYVFCLGFVEVEGGPVDLYPQQSGEVVEIAPTKNADGTDRLFRKDETIIRIDDRVAKANLGKAQAALKEAQVKLDAAKRLPQKHALDLKQQEVAISAARIEKAKVEAEENAKLRAFQEDVSENTKRIRAIFEESKRLADDKIQAEQLKLQTLKLVNPQEEIDRAEADVRAKQGDVDLAKLALDKCAITAPVDGTALQVYAKVGEFVSPQLQASAVKFCPNTARLVKAEVLQEWTHLVKVGQPASIEDEAHKDRRWQGKVKSVSDYIGPKRTRIVEPFMTNDVRTMECVVEFAEPARVIIGQRVRIKIKL